MLPAPRRFQLSAEGEMGEPVEPVIVNSSPALISMVMVLPEAEVETPGPPMISRLLERGTAVPLSVVKLVGIWGFVMFTSMRPP